jgi:hypothetical protein
MRAAKLYRESLRLARRSTAQRSKSDYTNAAPHASGKTQPYGGHGQLMTRGPDEGAVAPQVGWSTHVGGGLAPRTQSCWQYWLPLHVAEPHAKGAPPPLLELPPHAAAVIPPATAACIA